MHQDGQLLLLPAGPRFPDCVGIRGHARYDYRADRAANLQVAIPLQRVPIIAQSSPAVLEVSPFSLAERTAFVGRESERSAIRAAIDRALSGHGSLVMLAGGPGVGKTRLAMEMAEYASRMGFRCSVGHCYERDEPFPYPPVRRDY